MNECIGLDKICYRRMADHGEVDFEVMLERVQRSILRAHRTPGNINCESCKEVRCR